MLSEEFCKFYGNWSGKADTYHANELRSAFDRYFTLFVVFNRLYAETTFELARRGLIQLPKNRFPDRKAATKYVLEFFESDYLIDELRKDPRSLSAVEEIKSFLPRDASDRYQFAIKLSMPYGQAQPQKDAELFRKLDSVNKNEQAEAILEFLYSIRCNLFHGHKGFDAVQLEVLRPANALLAHVNRILFERLNA